MQGPDALVVDLGSGTCSAGLAGDDYPRIVISSQVGRPRLTRSDCKNNTTKYVGPQLQKQRELLSISSPFSRSVITNWDDVETIFNYFYEDLAITSSNHQLMASESPFNPKANREKLAQMMFETFQVTGMCVAIKALLSFFFGNYVFGTVVDSGEGVTHVLTADEGVVFTSQMTRMDVAGGDITEHIRQMLHSERGYILDKYSVKNIKEQYAYVALDFEEEMRSSANSDSEIEKNYLLPDGNCVSIGRERFQGPEVMFRPSLIGRENEGIHKLIYHTIMKSQIDTRRIMFGRVILSGGNTKIPGFKERLHKELSALAPIKVKIEAAPDREHAVWAGGSLMASLSNFTSRSISKQDFEEYGPSIMHIVCF